MIDFLLHLQFSILEMISQALPTAIKLNTNQIQDIGVIFKTHLDLGFTSLAAEVYRRYMAEFMPRATRLALDLDRGQERFIWTTGSWLVDKYLEHSRGAERRRFEQAIGEKLIRWHALPFTFQTEALDESLLEAALSISQRLDRRFGFHTTAAKMTDVPGHTRGMIPVLAAGGVKLLHIGVNPASPVPDVPPVFRWKHPSGSEVIVCYDETYGGYCPIPGGTQLFAVAMTGDNAGPPSVEQIQEVYARMRNACPKARITACTLEEMAAALDAHRDQLPVVTSEIGDTWIHGYGSDPWKMAAYRQLARLRGEWIANHRLDPASLQGRRFDEQLLLAMEHTWGLDEKTWMSNGQMHKKITDKYSRPDFLRARRGVKFRRMEASWAEQREYIHGALQSIVAKKSLHKEATAALAAIEPVRDLQLNGVYPGKEHPVQLQRGPFKLSLQPDGALRVAGKRRGILGLPLYQVFGGEEYRRYFDRYVNECEREGVWAPMDFAKPGVEKILPKGKSWKPVVQSALVSPQGDRLVIESAFPKEAVQEYGAPARLRTEIDWTEDGRLLFDLQWFKKTASRIPEAIWFSFFAPVEPTAQWELLKMGGAVDPREVVSRGGRSLHIVQDGVRVEDASGSWHFRSLDAGLVAPGKPSLVDFHDRLPDASKDGIHFNLLNNTWGTNYPMWYQDDARFRFEVEMPGLSC